MCEVTGETSDGYHTFNELYEHRHALFALIVNIAAENGMEASAWKTWRNQEGEKWDGWFIAGLDTFYGQISYHMPAEWWDRVIAPEIERNANYDGHTSKDVLNRLRAMLGA